jgi:single-strand binding protein|nr:MAG TPA: Single strand binding protein [Caudoviricetes sp.]
MNKVILLGRLTRDPEVRYTQGNEPMAVARYSLAVDRQGKKDENKQNTDFISCVAFGKRGEFAEKYLHKGTKIAVCGRLQTGSYTAQDGILQAFPMDRWRQVVSDSQAYKQFGNAVTVTLFKAIAEEIANSIHEAEKGE